MQPSSPSATPEAPSSGPDSLVGKRIDKYEVVRVIGRGGMGTVYEALNTSIGKRVAMKFVDIEAGRKSEDSIARFQREAQAASAVESAHIVEIFDSGTTAEGQPFIVMELLRGEDLGHRIKRDGRLDVAETIHIGAQLLRGLRRAHEAGIVHRDLKPDNVFLVDRDDDPAFIKILDFGISKMRRMGETPVSTLTRRGTVLGTPFYMAPEQAQAQPDIDERADLWSVGAILYECLTGRPPYTGSTYEQVIVNICMKDADDVRLHNPAVPEAIARTLRKALARDRDDRFGSAKELLDALKAASEGIVSSREAIDSGIDASSSKRVPKRTSGADTAPPGGRDTAPSKVGWTSSREAAQRDRRTFLVVASSALIAGALGAFVFVRLARPSKPIEPIAAVSAPPAIASEQATTMGPDLPKPPRSAEIAPSAEPPPSAQASASAPVVSSADAKKPPKVVVAVAKSADAPKTPPTPSAKSSGVAGQLQLKTD